MESRKYIPRAPLSSLVECFWYWEGTRQTHSKERLLPNGEPSIIFNLRDSPIRIYDAQDLTSYASYRGAVLSGARSNCFVIDTEQQERVIGIQFKPGGAFPLFRMPAWEAENTSLDLDYLWRGGASEIREQVLASSTVDAMFATLERFLFERLVHPPQLHPAVTYALTQFRRSAHSGRIAAVTDRISLSPRRFIELFKGQVGLPPKVFCRVRRFQRVLQTIHQATSVDWAHVALDCGYYDQSHFIHDFRSFSGLSPQAYLAAATPHLNHVPLD
jgi:AraC-like DNA-binding protein